MAAVCGSKPVAVPLNWRVASLMAVAPPVSAISMIPWPLGLTSSTLMSEAYVWLTLLSVTVRFVIRLGTHATWIVEGYGVAGLKSAMVMASGLAKVAGLPNPSLPTAKEAELVALLQSPVTSTL